MSVVLPKLRVGEPVRHEALCVFPLFDETERDEQIDYRLSHEALSEGSLLVEEVSLGGSVPELLVENKGDVRVLFLEGEELVGAKQNRILNMSVLVPARSKIEIPVSCVEAGRWRYKSRRLGPSGAHAPAKLRRTLKSSVSRSVRAKRGHRSDQGRVWAEVDHLHAVHKVQSESAAMADAFKTYKERIDAFREKLKCIDGAVGVAVAVGGNVVAVDLFDKPSTCRKVWDRLLSGVVFDALEAGQSAQQASVADVEQLLSAAGDFPWEQSEAVGEGVEYRAESKRGDHATVLAFEQVVIHASIMAAV